METTQLIKVQLYLKESSYGMRMDGGEVKKFRLVAMDEEMNEYVIISNQYACGDAWETIAYKSDK